MTWLQRHRVRHYTRNSIVVLPVLGIVAALVTVWLLHAFEKEMGWESSMAPDAVRLVIGTLAAAMLTFIVFLSSALLLAVQLASGQLTPRIIAFVFRDPVTKFSLTIFVYTFTLSVAVLARIESAAPPLTSRLAVWGCVASLCVFFYLIDHVGKALRPSGVLKFIGAKGREVIEGVYPRRLAEFPETPREIMDFRDKKSALTINSFKGGVVLAFDMQGLGALAMRANCLIEMVPQVGDFVAADSPIFRVYQDDNIVSAVPLCQCVALGQERTVEQDPALAFRIAVDIACKALSPAINDPTTAVLALDQLHHLLAQVGNRHLDEGVIRDERGRARFAYRTPDWEDFVQLAVTEIRHYGGQSIQVVRRLRAMLENLIETLPEERARPLRQELSVLQRTVERHFFEPEDRALAAASDSQGVGGTSERSPKRSAAHPGSSQAA
ncbi:MAG TPA: DUF2254 domain-containing protein [Blastocatellia bacterium]|nr:DUF2254 domain-containing protein [Blastocatellia bacterium]